MKIGTYKGVDALVTAIIKTKNKDNLNNLLSECFPRLFCGSSTSNGGNIFSQSTQQQTFLQHLFSIPLPIRDDFTFFLVYAQENSGIPVLDTADIIVAFGMLDCSKYIESSRMPYSHGYNLTA